MRKLARGGVGGMLASVVSGLGGLAFITIAARFFSREDVGIVFALTSLFLIAVLVVTLGSETGIIRFVAVKRVEAPEQVAGVMTVTVLPVLAASVVAGVGVWVTAPWLVGLTGYDDAVASVRLLAVFLPLSALSHLVLAGTRGLGTVGPTIVVDGVLRQGLQPLLALVAALVTDDYFWLVAAWVVPWALSAVLGSLSLRRHCRRVGLSWWAPARSPQARAVAGEVWRFNAARSVTQIAQVGIRRADIPLVAALAGPSAAAVYTAASRFVAAGLQAIKGTQQMVGPQMARLMAGEDHVRAAMALRTATTWNVLMAWPVYLTCAAVPTLILALFGDGYDSGEMVVVILSLAMLIGTAAGPVDIALLMLGRAVQSLRNNMAALVTNLALNVALIPVLGIEGAALAWAASIVVSNALPTWQIRPMLGWASDRRTLLAAALAIGTFGLVPLAARLAFSPGVPGQLASVAVAGVAYLALLWWFRHTLSLGDLVAALRRRRRKGGRGGRVAAPVTAG